MGDQKGLHGGLELRGYCCGDALFTCKECGHKGMVREPAFRDDYDGETLRQCCKCPACGRVVTIPKFTRLGDQI